MTNTKGVGARDGEKLEYVLGFMGYDTDALNQLHHCIP